MRFLFPVAVAASCVVCLYGAEKEGFERTEAGGLPSGWIGSISGQGTANWTVEPEESTAPRRNVLKQSGWTPKPSYPLCVNTNAALQDGFVEVKYKCLSGTNDQAAGVVWRYRDPANYYVARANALEDNVVLYKVEQGKRTALDIVGRSGGYGVKVKVPPRQWGTLRVSFKGQRFHVLLNGRELFAVEDATFRDAGQVGVWTKADSVTLFDDFQHGTDGSASAAVTPPAPEAADWPQFRGPRRDGRSAEKGLLKRWPQEGPKALWSVKGIGQGFTHVSVANGLIYVTGLAGKEGILSAYTPNGEVKWRVNYGPEWSSSHAGARSIPTVCDGLVYVASGVGNVACFNAADGSPIWSVKLFEQYEAPQVQWGYAESLLVDGDRLLCTPCGKKATMVALNRKTGQPLWASPALGQASSFCSPLIFEHRSRRMIVTMTENAVVAFAPEDGQVLWQHPYENARQNHPVTPIYHEGILYVTSGYGKGAIGLQIAEDGRSVRQIWEQPRQDPVHGQAVLVDGHVYASSHQKASGRWSCVELKTGKQAWEAPGVGKGGSVIFADQMLYCYSEDGVVGLVRPSTEKCEAVSTFKVTQGDGPHWAHLVVANGRLYVRHGDVLICYDVRG